MENYLLFLDWFEKSFNDLKEIYNKLNELDLQNNGISIPYEDIKNLIKTSLATDNINYGHKFKMSDMKTFLNNVFSSIYSYSVKNVIDKYPYAYFKIHNNLFGKQKLLLLIANTICEDKFGKIILSEI